MITDSSNSVSAAESVSAKSVPSPPSTALPGFSRLAGGACLAGLLPIGLLLVAGQAGLAGSVALGVAVSLGVCGLLFLFIERVMPVFVGTSGAGSAQGSQLQFMILLGAKLVFIALVGAAFLTLRHINPIAVLAGFLVGQTTMVMSALRYRKL